MALLSVLTVNSGSSSLKASLFTKDGRRDFRYEHLDGQQAAFDALMREIGRAPDLIGHRIVHGGDIAEPARLVDAQERARLDDLIPLAPLHLPGNLLGIDLCSNFGVPQIACFDTAFHAGMPELSRRLPIPEKFGLRRYGFHGLNYAHVASKLPEILGEAARGRVIAAHLGSGASLCLMQNLQSVDTTMGFSPAGGIVMGTRSGDLDPGAMLELSRKLDEEALEKAVYHEMGLIALSNGESPEMTDLLASESRHARFAIAYFCSSVRGAIGALAAKAGGVDAIVFSGGIGEHSPKIRGEIIAPLAFLGFSLNEDANQANRLRISESGSRPVLVVPADEELMIRNLCLDLIST